MRPGTRIEGRFVIHERAGAGGMGTVYRALDEPSGATVAVKIVHESEDRFAREVDILARMDHPAIVRYLAHGILDDGGRYLVMEWMHGEDLQHRLARGKLSPPEALALGRCAAAALAEIHARGIVHRDLKPSNIWLRDGHVERPVLLDFGIARSVSAGRLTMTGHAVGTPQYMAPEQVQGRADLDARADVYGLGAVLFECLAGRPPVVGDNAVAVLAKVLLEDAPLLHELDPSIPRDLSVIVRCALAKRREERYADARALLAELERLALGMTPTPPTAADAVTTRLGSHERRLVCVVMAGDQSAVDATVTPEQRSAELDRARTLASVHGARLVPLGGGYLACAYTSSGLATDLLRRAARYALALAADLPSSVVAIGMGFGTADPVPVGEAIDRASHLLRASRPPSGVRVDDVGAGLLEISHQLATDESGHILVAERRVSEPPRTLLGRPTSCVGRDRELATLVGLLDAVEADGAAYAALVTAPAGGGKSRVRFELLGRLVDREPPPAIWVAHAEMLRAGSPLDLLVRCVRAIVDVDEGEPEPAVQERVQAHVKARLAADRRADVAEFLCELVGAPLPAGIHPRLDAARSDARSLGDQMLRAWIALLAAECERRTCVLVLEDLHWSDPQTVRFFDAALRQLAGAPLFVLALARPDVHDRFPGLWRDRPLQEIRLGALPARACLRLVQEVLGDVDGDVVDEIVRHAEGNAFFLEELIRASASGRTGGAPASVVAMVQARLEALDAATRRVARAASVFGEACHRDGLVAVLGRDDALDDALTRLVDTELMVRKAEDEYAFRHALVREAAYVTLVDADRQLVHQLAARWLEAMHERDALLLAGHYEAAGALADAARCLAEAAHQALDANDFDAALARAKRALELGATGEARRHATIALGRTYRCLGRLAEAQAELEAALAMTDEPAARIILLRDIWSVAVFRQEVKLLRDTGNEAMAIAEQLDRPELVAEATAALALADHADGKCEEGVERFLVACEKHRDRASLVMGLSSIMLYHVARFDEALRWSQHYVALAREVRDWETVASTHANVALAFAAKGNYAAADEEIARARETAEQCGLTMMLARAIAISAGWRIAVYNYAAAEAIAHEARHVGRAIEFSTPRVSALVDLAAIAVRREDPGDAERMLDTIAETIGAATGFHGWLWRSRTQVLRAEIAAARRDWPRAVELARASVAQCDGYRRVKYATHARTLLARGLHATGADADISEILGRAARESERCGDRTLMLRVELARLACGDSTALATASQLATAIEAALPSPSAATFRASRELRPLG